MGTPPEARLVEAHEKVWLGEAAALPLLPEPPRSTPPGGLMALWAPRSAPTNLPDPMVEREQDTGAEWPPPIEPMLATARALPASGARYGWERKYDAALN